MNVILPLFSLHSLAGEKEVDGEIRAVEHHASNEDGASVVACNLECRRSAALSGDAGAVGHPDDGIHRAVFVWVCDAPGVADDVVLRPSVDAHVRWVVFDVVGGWLECRWQARRVFQAKDEPVDLPRNGRAVFHDVVVVATAVVVVVVLTVFVVRRLYPLLSSRA